MSLAQLKQLVKDNGIKGVSHLTKKELTDLLVARKIEIPVTQPRVRSKPVEVIPIEVPAVVQAVEPIVQVEPVVQEVANPKYDRLKTIRKNPRQVSITDITTGEILLYKSLYSAGKALGHSSKIINDYNGRVYKDRYQIEILGAAPEVAEAAE